ncbi:UNVERIFIED_CONTAM: putative receptor-like protein kinase [Sesamum angustifolium]|uniref:Receptor-like protein kinase n=1 Tax=Sesamum angustifolium TaxID=2727405 RepID=A0AAW2QD32_9LAMI
MTIVLPVQVPCLLPPPTSDSTFNPIQISFRLLGPTNSIATVVITVICLINVIVHILQQNQGANFSDDENKPSVRAQRLCRRFSLAEIQSATQNFNGAFVIGKGGFGKVYKGLIDKGKQTVAIKRLKSNSRQGKREFWTEIEMLSELRHVNLVSLIGYCNEHLEMILVYEHMPFGTLADHLYKLARKTNIFSSLSWKQRCICIGAGRDWIYLHTKPPSLGVPIQLNVKRRFHIKKVMILIYSTPQLNCRYFTCEAKKFAYLLLCLGLHNRLWSIYFRLSGFPI